MKEGEEASKKLEEVTRLLKESNEGWVGTTTALTLLGMSMQVQTLKLLERIEEQLSKKGG